MTYAARKAGGICTQRGCHSLCAEDSLRCSRHADTQREHAKRSAQQVRELRRDNGLCADCPAGVLTPSVTYRCPKCAEAKKQRDGCSLHLRAVSTPA